jgi:uncharacterized iron-regulated membrane protein
MFRKILFWSHLCAGVLAGLVILMMSATGVLLSYERQLQVWEDRSYYSQPEAGQERLTVDQLVEKANATADFTATSLALSSDPAAPAVARMGRSGIQHLNPYTGVAYTPHSDQLSAFFSDVRSLHRWFMVSGEGRSTARNITGAANLLFLFLLVSGSYLWLPRIITWATVKVRLWFDPYAKTPAARDFNWHHVFSFWAAIPLLVIVPTASVFNYGWANDMVYWLAGDAPPQRGGSQSAEPVESAPDNPQPLEALFVTAQSYSDSWRTISITLPEAASASVDFSIDEGNGGQPQRRHSLTLDRESGAEQSWVPFTAQSSGVQARRWVRFLHTGEALGLIGQTVAALASMAGVLLVWTGLSLALRRFLRWRSRSAQRASQAAASS